MPVRVPESRGALPPGPYLLQVVDARGHGRPRSSLDQVNRGAVRSGSLIALLRTVTGHCGIRWPLCTAFSEGVEHDAT